MATFNPNRRSLVDQIPTEDRQGPAVTTPANSGIHSTELGRQAFNTAMALPGIGGVTKAASTGGLIGRAFNSAVGGTNKVAALGAGTTAVTAFADAAADTQSPQPSTAGAGRGSINPENVNPAAAAPEAPANPLVAAGPITFDSSTNTYSGSNVAADAQIVNGRGGGSISAQNMQAADQLAGKQQSESLGRSMRGGALGGDQQLRKFNAPTVAHSGNDAGARMRLADMKTSASSIMNSSRWGGRRANQNPSVMAFMLAQQADLAAQGKQPGMEMQAMGLNAGLEREGMQQAGADRRDQRRGLVDMARLQGEQETQGFANRAAGQQEQLRNTLLDPKATPEQRAVAQRSLAALSGKTAADRMQTVNLPDTTTDMGAVVRGGQALIRTLEDGSVQQVPIGAQQQIPANHIAALRSDPKLAAQFDAQYGPGASQRHLAAR